MNFIFRRSYRGPLQAAIMDWAGTMLDYGCYAPAVVFLKVFEQYGVTISMAEARLPMGTQKKDHIRWITQMERVAEAWVSVHGHPPTEAEVEALYQAFIPLQLACIADYADLIPGTLEAVQTMRQMGLKLGSSTGYNRAMLDILLEQAQRRGLVLDSNVSASEVPAGRPAPWMCLQNAMQLGVYPLEAVVKIGDTVPDIDEGLNAGMWTVGVAKTGNEIGLTAAEIAELSPSIYQSRLQAATQRLAAAGAHYVIETIAEIEPVLLDINRRLAQGEKP